MFRVDQCPAAGGVLRHQQLGQRHVGIKGVGVIGVAVGHGKFQRLDHRVDRLGFVALHRREVVTLENLECLKQAGALRPRAAFVDGMAAIGDGDRLLDPGGMRGQVVVADQAAVGPRPGVDPAGDRPAVEGVGDQPQPARAIGRRVRAAGNGEGLRGDEGVERPGEIGVPGLAAGRSGQQPSRRLDDLGEGHRAEAVEQRQAGVERRRDGRGRDPLERDAAAPRELVAGRQPRGCALAGDHGHAFESGRHRP